jgi:hypothetical protein
MSSTAEARSLLALTMLLVAAGCGAQRQPPGPAAQPTVQQRPDAEPSGQQAAPRPMDDESEAIPEQAEKETDFAEPPPAAAPPAPSPGPGAGAAPETAADSDARQMTVAVGQLLRAEAELSAALPDCRQACRALAAMRRSVRRICGLEPPPGRCRDARRRLAEAERRVSEACGRCRE